ncbi:MAG: ABC transporter ATP-binding protein [Lachnospiraceae bacterium]|nr:ABC transporter ATP-binding protein [Lachnospiraceae bacterium]
MLEYKNVSLSCDGTELLKNINIGFKKGELTTIIGPNGCGKTTLIQALNGSSRLTAGEILLDRENYLSFKPRIRAERLSFLPQIRQMIPTLSVRSLVSHGRFPRLGFSRKMSAHDKELVEEAMRRADVEKYADQSADTLSGGVRQRAFVALQLAQDCDCVVADEPTTYLDAPSQKQILKIYRNLRDEGRTVILVLHDIAKALEISDRVVVMNDRRIITTGKPDELIGSGIIDSVFGVKLKSFSDADGKYYVL